MPQALTSLQQRFHQSIHGLDSRRRGVRSTEESVEGILERVEKAVRERQMKQWLRRGGQIGLLVAVRVIDGFVQILVNTLEDALNFASDDGNVVDG